MLNVELTCRRRDNVRLIYEDEIFANASPDVRRHRGWPVRIAWHGETTTTWVIPDRFFGLEFLDKPRGSNKRFFALEYDRGTMAIERSNPHQTCYQKKLVAYAHTYADQLHKKHLCIPYFYTLTVTTGRNRVAAIIEKSADCIHPLAALSAFLFIPDPLPPSHSEFQNVFEMAWQNATSKKVTFPT